jgi:NAD(P)-dependent dehydrogenase (short-subunit alcohol dehydrogenase family)
LKLQQRKARATVRRHNDTRWKQPRPLALSVPALLKETPMNSHDLLAERTIIVTGAATGIGQAFAIGAAAQGANVVVADMNAADQTVASIEAAGGRALAVRLDVADDASCQAMARAALDRFGRIDGLVNNAAYFREVKLTPFEELDPAQWDRIFQVNVKGVWHCCKAVMPAMRERKSGAIVNIASVVAVAGQPGYLHYVATKGAVLSMTKGLAKECGPHGVRVNVIAPGFVITDATKSRPIEWQQSFLKARAISREQRPDDLVGTALYLMSDLAAFVTGQTIVVDGGHIMY